MGTVRFKIHTRWGNIRLLPKDDAMPFKIPGANQLHRIKRIHRRQLLRERPVVNKDKTACFEAAGDEKRGLYAAVRFKGKCIKQPSVSDKLKRSHSQRA